MGCMIYALKYDCGIEIPLKNICGVDVGLIQKSIPAYQKEMAKCFGMAVAGGLRRDEKGCGLKGLKIAQYLAKTKEKLCKVIPNYAENVNKSTITEILQNCCKCRKYSKIKRLERF